MIERIYMRIVAMLPKGFAKLAPSWTLVNFGLSSVGCMLIEMLVFSAICVPVEPSLGRKMAIAIAVPSARLVSGNCNFLYNMHFVFRAIFSWKAYFQYWSIVLINVSLLLFLTQVVAAWLDVHGLLISFVNFSCEVCLFLISFLLQKFIVFRRRES